MGFWTIWKLKIYGENFRSFIEKSLVPVMYEIVLKSLELSFQNLSHC